MSIFNRLTTKHTFDDGTKISLLHRYALRVQLKGHLFDVGFEQAFECDVDRLIHENSIVEWLADQEVAIPINESYKKDVLDKVIRYCKIKEIKYRVVS